MAIPIVEDIIWRQLPIDTPANMRTAVIQALLDAGWTLQAGKTIERPYNKLTMTGLPSNGQTIVIGTKTYTFRTVLSSGGTVPNEVLIGFDVPSTASYLASAIGAGPGAGLTYGTGTAYNPAILVATGDGTGLYVEGRTVADYGATCSTNAANATWKYLFLADVSDTLLSVPTARDGLQFAARVFLPWIPGVNCIGIQIGNVDWTKTSEWNAGWYNAYGSGQLPGMHPKCLGFPEIVAHKHGAFLFYRGNPTGYGNCWFQTVQLPLEATPKKIEDAVPDAAVTITEASNLGTDGNVRITAAGHGFADGETVYFAGVEGLPDGNYTVALVDPDHVDLAGTSGYAVGGTAGSGVRDASVLVYQPGHGLISGQNVSITDPPTPATLDLRGQWQVAVVDADYYRLAGSHALVDPYDAGNQVKVAGPGQCTQAMFCGWDLWNLSGRPNNGFIRSMLQWPLIGDTRNASWESGTEHGESWVCYNQIAFCDGPNAFGDSSVNNFIDFQMYGASGNGGRSWFGNRYYLLDAVVGWSVEGYTAATAASGVGYLFNTLLVTKDLPMDAEVVDDEGNKWLVITRQRTDISMAVLMRVPQGYN